MATKLYVKKKEIKDTCWGCPNAKYDRHSTIDYDSGSDCIADGSYRRIADDTEINKFDTLAVRVAQGKQVDQQMVNPMIIPAWCPLPDSEEEDSEYF